MEKSRIKNLSDLLKDHIGDNKTIVDVKETPLVAAGENFGGYLLRLDITLKNENNNEEEKLHLVAKLISDDSAIRNMFNIQATVKKEIQFYNVIVPALQQFQREHGIHDVIDCFPKFYGGRLNLHGNDEIVDEDSAILMENLIASGYENVDRLNGYDLESAKMILKNLAQFHAIPIAMKIKNPEKFEEIKAKCVAGPEDAPPPPEFDENRKSPGEQMLEVLYESDKCLPYITKMKKHPAFGPPPRRDGAGKTGPPEGHPGPRVPPVNEPWGTIYHSDMWINNQMVKFQNGKPAKAMIVDFQMYDYSSPTNDLFFFIWSSIQKSVLEEHLDDLLKYYHDCFTKSLIDFDCDVAPFSFPKFLEELSSSSKHEFFHVLMMMFAVILGKKGGNSMDPTKPNFYVSSKDLSVPAKERIWFIVQECGKRNWIRQ